MPPLVYETVAWVRFYSALPIPPLPGETDPDAAPDPNHTAHAVPIAGAVIGAIGGIVLILAWALHLSAFLAAALAIVAIVIATGAFAEQALAVTVEQFGKPQPAFRPSMQAAGHVVRYGVIALVIAVLLRVGALEGLVAMGTLKAALALVAAGAISRAASVSFALTHPASRSEGSAVAVQRIDVAALQRLAIVAFVIVAAAILPTYGIGPTVAGLAAAIGTSAAITALAPHMAGGGRELGGVAEQTAEITFLVAVLVFARGP